MKLKFKPWLAVPPALLWHCSTGVSAALKIELCSQSLRAAKAAQEAPEQPQAGARTEKLLPTGSWAWQQGMGLAFHCVQHYKRCFRMRSHQIVEEQTCHRNSALKKTKHKSNSADFSWDWVNFLYSSYCGALVWICAGNSIDNTSMF